MASEDKSHEEYQYLGLIRRLIDEKTKIKGDRTGVGTINTFGEKMVYSLRNGTIPIFTTKRVFINGVVKELFWMISGSTDSQKLHDMGVRIWDANGSRAFLDNLGLVERREGDLGPVYGHQWRHFGATYVDCGTDYTGQGVDQLQQCIDLIRNEPTSRRIVMSAWNPHDQPLMALPPCHMFCQFFVEDGELSCLMYQRSCDLGLGVPFNVASYSLLTHMIAHICHLKPGNFIHMMGDTHIYANHIEPLKTQLERTPYPFPTIEFTEPVADIDSFKIEHIKINNYSAHPTIQMDMAV